MTLDLVYFSFSIILILCTLMILKSKNPVHSVLFLVLVFYFSSIILFLFEVDFLALTFIIIYVGAIAVLFLFVVMMLDLKKFDYSSSYNYYFLLLSIFVLFLEIFLVFEKYFFFLDEIFIKFHSYMYTNLIDELNNIDVIAQSLYNYYLICFLLAGIVLLVAVIGSIVLTLDFNNKERYLINNLNTFSRVSNKTIFYL